MRKTDMGSTSVSVKGDRRYVMTLKALAAKHNITIAELTRRALDKAYGEELKAFDAIFDESVVT